MTHHPADRLRSHRLRTALAALVSAGLIGANAAAAGQTRSLPRPSTTADNECVILLHGLARTRRSMTRMAAALQAAGFETVNLDYPSRTQSIERNATTTVPKGIAECTAKGGERLHFVTHSLGGIVVRYYLAHHTVERLGRVVMLSPPNHGSEVADALHDNRLYRWLMGPAGQRLGTAGSSLPVTLGPVDYPVGVITGNRPGLLDLWFASWIPGENDGKVSVNSARLTGMTDFVVVPDGHTFIMMNEEVIAQTIHFLRHGVFHHESIR